jgi:hypothetical protein
MQITIHRAAARDYWPDEGRGHRYSFTPIAGYVSGHAAIGGVCTGSCDDSTPLGTVTVPDGSEIDADRDLVFLPGETVGYAAAEVWQLSDGDRRRFDGI